MAKERKSLASRVKKTTTSPSIDEQEKALQKLYKKENPASEQKKKVRISVDFPRELYEIMKKDTKKKGQTLKGFIISLVVDKLDYDGDL